MIKELKTLPGFKEGSPKGGQEGLKMMTHALGNLVGSAPKRMVEINKEKMYKWVNISLNPILR